MSNILKELIDSDIFRHYENGKRPILWRKHNVALYCTLTYRKAHHYSELINNESTFSKRLLLGGLWIAACYYRFKLNRVSRKYFFQVPYSVKIGHGFNFVHFGRLIIAPGVSIGSNCNIFTGVTIGSTTRGSKKGVPSIGNEVWVGPNAVLVGGITIGDDVLISANSFVNFNVPSHSIVLGNPGRIIQKENATEGYICQKYKNI